MKTRKLGSQGVDLSVVGFGTVGFGIWETPHTWGPSASDELIVDAIRAGLDAGINWIDSAERYGQGEGEQQVARAISGFRKELNVATKVAPKPWGTGFRRDQIRQACIQSLQRLRTDWIDLYQLHFPDENGIPIEETWGTMAELVEEGLVRFIGVSDFEESLIERCLAIRHVDSLQIQLSILHPSTRRLIRWCAERGIGVLVFGPLAFGLLTGGVSSQTEFEDTDWRGGKTSHLQPYYHQMFRTGRIEKSLEVVRRLLQIAERESISLPGLSLAWVLHQYGVTSCIVGSRNPHHIRENALAADIQLGESTLAEIEEVSRLGPEFVADEEHAPSSE